MSMISSSRLSLVLLVLSLACPLLSACGNTHVPPEDVAQNPASGTAFARATLGRMPEAARQAFKDKLQAESTRLGAELKVILTSEPSGQLGRLAVFAQTRKANLLELQHRITTENGLLAQIDPEHIDFSGTDSNSVLAHAQEITTHRIVIAQAILMAGVEQKFLRRAVFASPVLREASQRQEEAEASGNAGTLSYYIEEMKREPCLFISPEASKPAPVSIRGIELGMNRRKVLDTLCASENGEVTIRAQSVGRTYNPESIEAGARLLGWDAYKRGKITYSPDYAGINAWLAIPENSAELQSLARPYLKTTRFCLHCTDTGRADGDILSVEYAPEGTVAAIVRSQRFTDPASFDSSGRPLQTDHASPQPMNNVLDPLRNQFGTPSFAFYNMVAWVYPNGQTPLQPETWSVQPSLDGQSTRLRLNDTDFQITLPMNAGTPAFMSVYKALMARPTPATYCVSKYAYDGLDVSWPLKALYADRFGARPYDPAAAAPGETDRCGVIVYAVLDVTSDDDNAAYVSDSTPVYGLTISIVNTTRLADIHKREAQTAIDRMNALAASSQAAKPVELRR